MGSCSNFFLGGVCLLCACLPKRREKQPNRLSDGNGTQANKHRRVAGTRRDERQRRAFQRSKHEQQTNRVRRDPHRHDRRCLRHIEEGDVRMRRRVGSRHAHHHPSSAGNSPLVQRQAVLLSPSPLLHNEGDKGVRQSQQGRCDGRRGGGGGRGGGRCRLLRILPLLPPHQGASWLHARSDAAQEGEREAHMEAGEQAASDDREGGSSRSKPSCEGPFSLLLLFLLLVVLLPFVLPSRHLHELQLLLCLLCQEEAFSTTSPSSTFFDSFSRLHPSLPIWLPRSPLLHGRHLRSPPVLCQRRGRERAPAVSVSCESSASCWWCSADRESFSWHSLQSRPDSSE